MVRPGSVAVGREDLRCREQELLRTSPISDLEPRPSAFGGGADDGIRTRDPHLGKVARGGSATSDDRSKTRSDLRTSYSTVVVDSRRFAVVCGTDAGRMGTLVLCHMTESRPCRTRTRRDRVGPINVRETRVSRAVSHLRS